MQHVRRRPWIPAFDIHYHLGLDGISFPLVMLTSFLSMLAMWASWPIPKHVKGYCILFLLLETGMLGVFMSLDFFLFYVFWEVMLLPMYFLIGVWGGPRREYAAIKFFLFTLVGSVLMLDRPVDALLRQRPERAQPQQLARLPRASRRRRTSIVGQSVAIGAKPVHTFNILALAAWANWPIRPSTAAAVGQIGPVVGLPAAVYRLRDQAAGGAGPYLAARRPRRGAHAHLDDPGRRAAEDGRLRRAPHLLSDLPRPPATSLAWLVCGVGVVSMVYGALAAMAQKDFKRLVAYSSVSHMGYVLLGIGVWSAAAGNLYNSDYWKMGISGAMFQMIAHGISSAGMFFLVGVVYDRVHHRDLDQFGGLFAAHAHLRRHFRWSFSSPPWACRVCAASSAKSSSSFRVWNYSMVLAVDRRLGRDPHRRLHPLDDPAGLPGTGVQGPARRGPAADEPA